MSSTQAERLPSERAVNPVPAIRLTGLTKSFGSVRAVRGIDLVVAPGEVVAVLGPNGAGKTTTIDLLLGLGRPDSGEVRVHGLDPTTAVRQGLVSAVMQSGGLLRDLTVKETLQLTASLFAGTRPVDEVLARAGISDIGDRRVGKCSGGQQQRLRFAMALLPDPELLVLDEPTTGMDVTGRRDFWNAIHEDAARGRTVVFATHYLEEADAYADRIVLVSHGRVVADGTAAEVKALVSGRTIRATLIDADLAVLQRIKDLPGVETAELRGDTLLVTSTDSDAVARHLLTDTTARDLEITTRGLEDAFITLTSEEDQP
ncbi:ABC transporter ATP-binding protein [Pedococcus sp. KACC 23699]|uniref:ABC transporter ATP-binding protein n=1 Tax=Pedococcus sp. KACC 23699 TaxID=3149228 RepID=A0AAU7JUV7_9MICO